MTKMDWMQQMAENAEKAQYIRAVFSPMSERTACTSEHYPDCLDCALGSALGCVHLVNFKQVDAKFDDDKLG